MAYEVFNPTTIERHQALLGMSYKDWPELVELGNGGPYQTPFVAARTLAQRTYTWPIGLDPAAWLVWSAFLRTVGYSASPFLLLDPDEGDRRTAVALGTGDGVSVTFSLPTTVTSEEYRYYPQQGTVDGMVAGVSKPLASVSTDGRTITFSTAPGNGLAVTASYQGLRLVRLVDIDPVSSDDPAWKRTGMTLAEEIR